MDGGDGTSALENATEEEIAISHFTVLVIGDDYEAQLAPYDENEPVEPYKSYWDSDAEKRWIEVLNANLAEGEQPLAPDCSHEELAARFNAHYNHGKPAPTALDLELGGEMEGVGCDEGGVFEWSTYPPQAKWDWYQVGGRWRGYFKLKERAENLQMAEVGEPGVFDNAPLHEADVVTKGDVDVEAMRAEAGQRAAERWDRVNAVVGHLPEADSWRTVLARHLDADGNADVKAARAEYGAQVRVAAVRAHDEAQRKEHGRELLDPFAGNVAEFQVTREQYVQQARDLALAPYAYVIESEWHGQGKMGWFGMSDDEYDDAAWAREFNERFDALPDDTLLTLVDCHV